ncbi:MAG: DUF1844 domain-containing protein, partial [Clostridia bacterium]|nr:DUF1844 domain-containing protein [Deltaproteobacteria bacterium]
MSEEEHEKKGFRIVDRRRFNAEGETREGVPERPEAPPVQVPPARLRQDPRAAAHATQSTAQPVTEPSAQSAPQQTVRAPAPAPEPGDDEQIDPQAQPQAQGAIDFISFIASLATNALASLGALPEARAQGVPMSLEMAREYIEIIGMLHTKTRGNLSREEEASLQRIVSELRMVYVEVTQRIAKGPPQPKR